MSTRRVIAIQGDPTWKEALAPARAWASLAWNAQTNPRGAELGLPTLLEMIQWYHQIRPEQQKSWQTSTGPIGRTHLALLRVGWSWISPFEWKYNNGVVIHLGRYSPKAIDWMLEQAVQRLHERSVADTLQVIGTRAEVIHLRTFRNAKGKRALTQ